MAFNYQHGLVVMRAQPLHIGHQRLIRQMLEQCEFVTLLLGSAQEYGTERNPFSFEVRQKMISNCFAEPKLHILGVNDINNPMRWAEYVLCLVKEAFPTVPCPDVYYAGSEYDAHWFEGRIPHIELVNRNDSNWPFVSATMVRDMLKFGDERWKNFVPKENIALIETHFNTGKVCC